jgi:MFS family permease
MTEKEIQVYGKRWVILLLFMFANITMQMLWISYGAITIESTSFYNVGELEILLLSLIFMVVYIPISFIASWSIDKYNFKIGASIGVILAGIFGFLRFIVGSNYFLAFICQAGIAVGQPFLLNSITKLSANWFPEEERTFSTGLGLISQFIGIALGVFISPFLINCTGGFPFLVEYFPMLIECDITPMLLTYGIISLASGILFVILVKDEPPTPPSKKETVEKVFMFEGLKKLFTNKYFLILVILFFIGLGTFNMITTYIELIVAPRGYSASDAGNIGAIMLFGGIIGCLVMSTLSDKYQKRKVLIIISVAFTTISLAVLSFTSSALLLYLFGFILGFGILSAGPVALEYAVDITRPVPEASSNGVLMMVGQIGGILFILGFVGFTLPSGDYLPALLLLTFLALVLLILSLLLKEPEK